MNKFEEFMLKKRPVWLHVILTIITYYIWIIVYLIVKAIVKSKQKTNSPVVNNNKPKNKTLYSKIMMIDCSTYIDKINKIINDENFEFEKYEGMANKEILECGYDVGEIDGIETPKIILEHQVTQTLDYFNVCMYYEKIDKFVKIGEIPKEETEEIKRYFDKKIITWGYFKGGKFKTDNCGKIETYEQDIQIDLLVNIYEK